MGTTCKFDDTRKFTQVIHDNYYLPIIHKCVIALGCLFECAYDPLAQVLECLYREKWSAALGLGALIISPTRELAYQTFEVLRKIGKKHGFSAGLVIGGKVRKLIMISGSRNQCNSQKIGLESTRLIQIYTSQTPKFKMFNDT